MHGVNRDKASKEMAHSAEMTTVTPLVQSVFGAMFSNQIIADGNVHSGPSGEDQVSLSVHAFNGLSLQSLCGCGGYFQGFCMIGFCQLH